MVDDFSCHMQQRRHLCTNRPLDHWASRCSAVTLSRGTNSRRRTCRPWKVANSTSSTKKKQNTKKNKRVATSPFLLWPDDLISWFPKTLRGGTPWFQHLRSPFTPKLAFNGRKERTMTHWRRSNFRPLKSNKGRSMYLTLGSLLGFQMVKLNVQLMFNMWLVNQDVGCHWIEMMRSCLVVSRINCWDPDADGSLLHNPIGGGLAVVQNLWQRIHTCKSRARRSRWCLKGLGCTVQITLRHITYVRTGLNWYVYWIH